MGARTKKRGRRVCLHPRIALRCTHARRAAHAPTPPPPRTPSFLSPALPSLTRLAARLAGSVVSDRHHRLTCSTVGSADEPEPEASMVGTGVGLGCGGASSTGEGAWGTRGGLLERSDRFSFLDRHTHCFVCASKAHRARCRGAAAGARITRFESVQSRGAGCLQEWSPIGDPPPRIPIHRLACVFISARSCFQLGSRYTHTRASHIV